MIAENILRNYGLGSTRAYAFGQRSILYTFNEAHSFDLILLGREEDGQITSLPPDSNIRKTNRCSYNNNTIVINNLKFNSS